MAETIAGMVELLKVFDSLSVDLQGTTLERAAVAGALPILNDTKRNAPYRTGTLRRSLHIGGHTDASAGFEGDDIGGNKTDEHSATVLIGTNVVYAARQEYGFMDTDSLGRNYHQVARPYLRPAMDNNHDKATEEAGIVFWLLIRHLAGTS